MTTLLERSIQQLDARAARRQHPDAQPITTRLSGGGSLRRELEALLAAAPPDADEDTYQRLVVEANVTSKASMLGRLLAWKRLRLWYLLDPSAPEFRAFLASVSAADNARERGLVFFLMVARTERLFREVTLECVSPHLVRDGVLIDPASVKEAMDSRVRAAGLAIKEATIQKAQRHLLSALKDFGVLSGSLTKRTMRPRPGAPTALFAVRLARLEGLTDAQALESRWFRLLGLGRDGAEDLLYTAARAGALRFRQQAGVVELVLPSVELYETLHR